MFGLNNSGTIESSERGISKQDLLYSGQIDRRLIQMGESTDEKVHVE